MNTAARTLFVAAVALIALDTMWARGLRRQATALHTEIARREVAQ